MRLEKLPLKLTTGIDFQSYGIIREKQCSDYTAGKNHLNVLGDNLLHEDSPTLCSVAVNWDEKSLENNHCTGIEDNLEKHFSANYAPENSCNQKLVKSLHTSEHHYKCKGCDYSTNNSRHLKTHVQAKHPLEKLFK